ncbi:hypothetical protein PAPYR_9959 [Paratrimastix pyriformis]|uniref:LRAT domain-containing protein n=1 Tax=Paratrimastix pyriformis TaxID=342808 RepID=A0ABQ8UCU7_9EUKA|nr:hypothetical protein PAPYR_9959 [Paratrimastix pyriformis]
MASPPPIQSAPPTTSEQSPIPLAETISPISTSSVEAVPASTPPELSESDRDKYLPIAWRPLVDVPNPGDHLRIRRHSGLYYHVGIATGFGMVVHFTGEPLHAKDARVREVPYGRFKKDSIVEVATYAEGSALPVESSVLLAHIFCQMEYQGYNVVTNNCEHLAVYCKTGYFHSIQVRQVAQTVQSVISHTLGLTHRILSVVPPTLPGGASISMLAQILHRGELTAHGFVDRMLDQRADAPKAHINLDFNQCSMPFRAHPTHIRTAGPQLGPINLDFKCSVDSHGVAPHQMGRYWCVTCWGPLPGPAQDVPPTAPGCVCPVCALRSVALAFWPTGNIDVRRWSRHGGSVDLPGVMSACRARSETRNAILRCLTRLVLTTPRTPHHHSCHDMHQLVVLPSDAFVCICGASNHRRLCCNAFLSRSPSSSSSCESMYRCAACQGEAICYPCAQTCHKDHQDSVRQGAAVAHCQCAHCQIPGPAPVPTAQPAVPRPVAPFRPLSK